MVDQDNVWYRLGYTLERAREHLPGADRLRTLEERRTTRKVGAAPTSRPGVGPRHRASPTDEPWDAGIAAGTAALVGLLLEAMPHQRKPDVLRLLRAAAAGAASALLHELVRALISGIQRPPLPKQAVLAGTARGLVYGALVEPRIPGPPLVRGAAYGWLEHLLTPWGGLTNLVGARAPHRRVPFLAALLDDFEPSDDTLVDHLLFGIALAALCGARPDEDEE